MNKQKVLLLLPMKTATTTIHHVLHKSNALFLSPQQARELRHGLPHRIANLHGEDIFQQALVALFVRNPYDRMVSCYEFTNATRRKNKTPEFSTFELFCKQYSGFKTYAMSSYLTLTDKSGANIAIVDFIGRFENLTTDIKKLLKLLGLNDQVDIPHLQKREVSYRPYQEYYTKELQDFVYNKLISDFQIFNYPYEMSITTEA